MFSKISDLYYTFTKKQIMFIKKDRIKFLFILVTSFCSSFIFCQPFYFQQQVDTEINITLDDVQHRIDGTIKIRYTNNAPHALDSLFLHVWGNAYSDRTTAFAQQQLRNRNTKFHFSKVPDRGNYESLAFEINKKPVPYSFYQGNNDIILIHLNEPVQPGETIEIETPLHLKIPKSFSRLGHVGTSYQMTQWFPKPAVYDQEGWHPMPYLNQGEFYSEFGDYKVTITLPENYYVGATGELQTEAEKERIRRRVQETIDMKSLPDSLNQSLDFPESSERLKTIQFLAKNVHDFAWFADKRFWIEQSNVTLSDGKKVDTYVFYTNAEKDLWSKAIEYVNRSTIFYSEKVGNYPYPQVTAVQSALSAGAGMEYPMITVIGLMDNAESLDMVITHEVGHNWFYGILGFNERDYPWLDEGINSYYDHRYMSYYYGKKEDGFLPRFMKRNLELKIPHFALMTQIRRGKDQPVSLHSDAFSKINYGLSAYEKGAQAFEYLSKYLGQKQFDTVMQSFYKKWAFKHPGPADIRAHFTNETGQTLDWFWDDVIHSNKEVDYAIRGIKKQPDSTEIFVKNIGDIESPIEFVAFKDDLPIYGGWSEGFKGKKSIRIPSNADRIIIDTSFAMLDLNMNNNHRLIHRTQWPSLGFLTSFDNSRKKQYFVTPAFGYNRSDGFMLGLGLHNLTIPMPRLKASIVSMYGLKSKKIVGTALLRYDDPIKGDRIKHVTYQLFSKQFSLPEFRSLDSTLLATSQYGILSPSITWTFHTSAKSLLQSQLRLKNTWVNIARRTKQDVNPIVPSQNKQSSFTELVYMLRKNHPIHKWDIAIRGEWQLYNIELPDIGYTNSIRTDLTLRSKYQYMKGNFLTTRIFVGFFPYHQDDVSKIFRPGNISLAYNPKSDYTFNSYFFGRGHYDLNELQQIGEGDGNLKLPLLQPYRFSYTDNYLGSIYLELTVPIKHVGRFFSLYNTVAVIPTSAPTTKPMVVSSGGIRLKVFDLIAVNFPLYTTQNLGNIYPTYGNKISFEFYLNKIEPIKLYRKISL